MSAIENVSRRGFMKGMVSAGALVLSVRFLPEKLWAEGLPRDTKVDHAVLNPSVYLGINTDGTVFIIAHRSEMGTGIRTSLPLVLADERRSKYGRFAFHPQLLRSISASRRFRADHADASSRPKMGSPCARMCG
jgi:hypothetical protein